MAYRRVGDHTGIGRCFYTSGMAETRPDPFMEHPTGQFATAVEAMADAIERLRILPDWSEWITFCAQGAGQHADSYHHQG